MIAKLHNCPIAQNTFVQSSPQSNLWFASDYLGNTKRKSYCFPSLKPIAELSVVLIEQNGTQCLQEQWWLERISCMVLDSKFYSIFSFLQSKPKWLSQTIYVTSYNHSISLEAPAILEFNKHLNVKGERRFNKADVCRSSDSLWLLCIYSIMLWCWANPQNKWLLCYLTPWVYLYFIACQKLLLSIFLSFPERYTEVQFAYFVTWEKPTSFAQSMKIATENICVACKYLPCWSGNELSLWVWMVPPWVHVIYQMLPSEWWTLIQCGKCEQERTNNNRNTYWT